MNQWKILATAEIPCSRRGGLRDDAGPAIACQPSSTAPHSCEQLHRAGHFTVVTVSPSLPIDDPNQFSRHISTHASQASLDHFIHGDGTPQHFRDVRERLNEHLFHRFFSGKAGALASQTVCVQVLAKPLAGRPVRPYRGQTLPRQVRRAASLRTAR